MHLIKVRAWDLKLNFMHYGGEHFQMKINEDGELKHKELIYMLCSDLLDCTGQEIYDGDIIGIPDDWDTFGWNSGEIFEVYFKYGGFRLKPKNNPEAKGFWLEDTEMLKVIGNIYETPELTPQGKTES